MIRSWEKKKKKKKEEKEEEHAVRSDSTAHTSPRPAGVLEIKRVKYYQGE
jgi:hypothetical protein